MLPIRQKIIFCLATLVSLLDTIAGQEAPTCRTAGGFCWPLASSCPDGFRSEVNDPYSCSQAGQQCCVLVAECEMNDGFCWSLNSQCPQGYSRDEANSNYYGCSRVDRQCCTKIGNSTQDPKDRSVCGLGGSQTVFRILNGAQTGTCDWPFVVSIRGRDNMTVPLSYMTSKHACAGVLIDNQWVLTSPICVLSAGVSTAEAPSRILVVAGEHNITGLDIDPQSGQPLEQVIQIEAAFFEPRYPFTFQQQTIQYLNDAKTINSHAVALLRLRQPISGKCMGVACLPLDEEAGNSCAKQEECVILGWGYNQANFKNIDDILRKGRTRLTSRTGCNFLTQRLNVTDFRPQGTTCQSPRDANTDSCLGDEGGPILCATGDNWVVRGVLPFNLCREGNYNLWVTEVANYITWIKQTMALYK